MIEHFFYNPILRRSVVGIRQGEHGFVLLYDHVNDEIVSEMTLPEGCGKALCLSDNGKYVASGYFYTKFIELRDTTTSKVVKTIKAHEVTRILFDRTTEYLIYSSKGKVYIYDLNNNNQVVVEKSLELEDGALNENNVLLIPHKNESAVVRVTFNPLSVITVPISIEGKVESVAFSPVDDLFFTLSNMHELSCFKGLDKEATWNCSCKDLVDQDHGLCMGVCSGDGKRLGLTITGLASYSIVVFETSNGQRLSKFNDTFVCSGYPFLDDLVLLDCGRFFSLQTGIFDNCLHQLFSSYKSKKRREEFKKKYLKP